MHSQLKECKEKDCIKAAQLECDAVPAMAYLEWCGIKLDENKWKEKMLKDQENLNIRKAALDRFVTSNPLLEEFSYIERQGDLFSGFDLTPRCLVNWDSSQQVIKVVKKLGFDTTVQDKQTGEDKDSVLEKTLKMQKGINDTFLHLYFDYKESSKVCSTYGQGHLNAINPKTGRIHTTFKQIGASSGRMSCGSNQSNTDLAKERGISASKCTYPNLQQLPADEPTRSSFVAEKGNMFVSCDWSAIESRLGGDIYQEQSIINEFLHGSGDMHSLVAKMVFPELKDIPVKDIKKKFPELRKAAKPIEFSQQFGGSEHAIQGAMGCTLEEALAFKNAYDRGFSGISKFKEQGSKFVQEHGYILICKYTGHKMYWWDWKQWKERQSSFTPEFWEEYRNIHKGTRDSVALMVKEHFKAASKYNRMALNSPTQGTGAICLKSALTTLFNWIIDNNLFNKVKICCAVHDELCVEFPETMPEFPKILEKIMEEAAAKYCKSLPIPAEASVANHWVH